MSYQIMCSNCGHWSRKVRFGAGGAEQIIRAGWNSFGDAFYCRKCCETWEKRNGKDRPLWGPEHTMAKILDNELTEMEFERLRKEGGLT